MKSIEFLGAVSNEVTGSCYLLTAEDGNQVLVDFGMFQGEKKITEKNYEMLTFNPSALQAVFLTHAHLDHSGRLPLLVQWGFKGKIYMTAPTRAFVNIILHDSARIAENDMTKEPLYTSEQVDRVMNMIEVVDYHTEVTIGSFKATFRDAGHILGSSSIELVDISHEPSDKIVFSGDLGNTPQDIVRPTEYIDSADYVVMESTYGDATHPDENPKEILQEEVNTVEKTNGILLIPAFALERTQEVLHLLHHLKEEGRVSADTKVFFDSPMGIDATSVYMEFKDFYNEEILSHTDIPFNFDGLQLTYDGRDSKDIIREPNPKVIIAGSGMMSGGRIMRHALEYLPLSTTRILFVGYQAEETMGRDILEGAKNVIIQNEQVPVRANIREIKTLSSHADQPRLMKWLSHIKGVKKVFLTHGEKVQRETLAKKIMEDLSIKDVVLPEEGKEYTLS